MKTIVIAAAVLLGLAAAPVAEAQSRIGNGAVGAIVGGVVAGPVGAAVGGGIGYTEGNRIRHGFRHGYRRGYDRRGFYRHHRHYR